ncbi:hypothetical protein LguiB_021031 [Lonicera macranthoides]
MNGDKKKWKNKVGLVDMPYTLLYPSSEVGLTGKGIPNSGKNSHVLTLEKNYHAQKKYALKVVEERERSR